MSCHLIIKGTICQGQVVARPVVRGPIDVAPALDTDPLHKPRVVQQCSTLSWCSLKRLTARLEFPLKRNKRNTEEEESQNQSVLCISFVSEIEGSWRPRLKKSRNV